MDKCNKWIMKDPILHKTCHYLV